MNTDTMRADLSDRVAEEIRSWMGRRRISGAALARALGVSPAWVSYRLTGVQPIDLNDLQRIAAILNVEVADLLPRASEGRVLPTGTRHRDEKGAGITIRKFDLTKRPGPNGHPKRTQPHPSTRRPGRVIPAHTAT